MNTNNLTTSPTNDEILNDNPILECKNLVKTFSNKQALKGINLSIKRGRIVGLLGQMVAGKVH